MTSRPMHGSNQSQDIDGWAKLHSDILDALISEAGNDTLLYFRDEDEGLALFLYEKFVHNKETPIEEVSQAVLLQALEEYLAIPPTEASSSIEEHPEPPDDPTEIGVPNGMQKCGWMDETTHKECPELVPVGRQSMLSHLNKAHNVRGPETIEIKCMWGVLQSGYKIPCGEKFQRRAAPRHISKHLGFRWQCKQCEKSFARSDLLRAHERDKHKVENIG